MRKTSKYLVTAYGFIGVIFALLGLLFYFLFVPNPYLTPFLLDWINKQGWGVFDVERIALHPHAIHLKNVKYTPTPEIPPVAVSSADLEISWNKFSPIIQGVILKDLSISKQTIENIMQAPTSSTSFSIPSLTFENATLSSDDVSFPFKLSLDGKFIPGKSFDGRFRLVFSDGEIGGTAYTNLSSPNLQTKFSNVSLVFKGWEDLHLPMEGFVTFENNEIQANFSSLKSDLKFENVCTYKLQDQTGRCTSTYESSRLANVIPKSLLQSYSIQNFSGSMEGSANLRIKKDGMEPIKGNVKFSDVSFAHPLINLKNLSTSVRYTFDKELSFPQQKLKILIDEADSGIPLYNLQLHLTWDGRNNYRFQKGVAFLKEGKITTKNVSLSLPFKYIRLPLKLKNIPAQFFVNLSRVPSLSISGLVGGNLDVELTEADYGIRKGSILYIQDPSGTIKYRPGTKPNQILTLTGDENPMDLVFLALWNFKYEKLSLDLAKPLQGQLQATLHLKGKNPKLLEGHPLEFNIKASGQLKELIENIFYSIKGL